MPELAPSGIVTSLPSARIACGRQPAETAAARLGALTQTAVGLKAGSPQLGIVPAPTGVATGGEENSPAEVSSSRQGIGSISAVS